MNNKIMLQLILVLNSCFAIAGQQKNSMADIFNKNPEANQKFTQTSALLTQYGFNSDFTANIEKQLASQSRTASEKQIMQDSLQRFELLGISREISAYILTRWQERSDLNVKQADLHKLIAQLLNMKLVTLPRFAVEAGMNANQAFKEKIEELVMLETKHQILDVLITAHGKIKAEKLLASQSVEVAQISNLLASYNQIRYNFLEVSQTPYLGKALLVASIHFYQQNKMENSLKALNLSLINDPKIAKDGFNVLTAKVNGEPLKPMDIVATWSDRLNDFYKSNNWKLATLKNLLKNHPALKDTDYNEFASVICLPSAEECLDNSEQKLKIHWLLEAPVLPSGGARIVDIQGFAPQGYVPRISYLRFESKNTGTLLRQNESTRQATIADFVYGSLVDSTKLNPKFSTLGIALSLSAFDPMKITKANSKIVTDKSQFKLSPALIESSLSSEAWVSNLSPTLLKPVILPSFQLSNSSLELIKTMPMVKAKLAKIENQTDLTDPSLIRATIQCTPSAKAVQMNPQSIKEFLYKLGFGDKYNGQWISYAEIMDIYNKKNMTYNDMTRKQQVRNIEDYKKVQSSVELATLIAISLAKCEVDENFVKRASALAATIASFEAPAAIIENPLSQKDSEAEHENPEQRVRYEKSLRAKMAVETSKLVKLILDSLYGSTVKNLSKQQGFNSYVKRIQSLSQSVIELAFMNHQIGRTRYLGRALIALLLQQAKLNGKYDLAWNGLSRVLENNQLALENFIGDKWKIRSLDKHMKTSDQLVSIYDMSYVYTRSINMESPTIPSGAIPGGNQRADMNNPSPYLYGKKMGLVGSFAAAAFVPSADATFNALQSWKDKKFYTAFNEGFSHVGYVAVREANGIKMSWVLDNYPTPIADMEMDLSGIPYNPGGIRISGLEQFYRQDHHSHFAVANMVNVLTSTDSSVSDTDYFKFFEYAKRQAKKFIENNYAFEFGGKALNFNAFPDFKVYSPVLHPESGKPLRNTETSERFVEDPWMVEISTQEFMKMHSLVFEALKTNRNPSRGQVKEWFDGVNKAALDKLYDLMYKGVTFVWITPYGQYFKGGAYCSLTGVLGWKLATGLDIQEVKDEWHSIVRAVDAKKDLLLAQVKESPEITSQIKNIAMMNAMPIVAPSGLAAQTYNRIQDVRRFIPPYQELADRYRRQFGREIQIKVDPAVTAYMVDLDTEIENYFEQTPLDYTEVEAIYRDTLEIAVAAKGCAQKDSVCGKKLKH